MRQCWDKAGIVSVADPRGDRPHQNPRKVTSFTMILYNSENNMFLVMFEMPHSTPVVPNLFLLETPFEDMTLACDPIQKYDIVAQPQPLTATLRCSNNNRQDEKQKHILHGSLHPLYLHSYA